MADITKLSNTVADILKQFSDKTPEAMRQYAAMKSAESIGWILWGIFLLAIVAFVFSMAIWLFRKYGEEDWGFTCGVILSIIGVILILPGAWSIFSASVDLYNYSHNPLGMFLDNLIKSASK